jgi:predicted O-methyltransferase YrrM
MHLHDALEQVAKVGRLNVVDLIEYTVEDNVGGRNTGWPAMSLFADEGRILYALVRALKPDVCVEVGVANGASSTHILAALSKNKKGHLYSYDIETDGIGSAVPDELRDRWTLTTGVDALVVDYPDKVDFVFEDGSHTYEFTTAIYRIIQKMNPKVMLTHDYHTHLVYPDFKVHKAFVEVFGGDQGVQVDGCFTGLGYWFNPDRM